MIKMLHVLKPVSRRTPAGALACGLFLAMAAQPVVAQDAQGDTGGDSGGDSGMTSRMILQLQQMREEVREMRGMVEAQAQEIENLKRRQRDQYMDLDRRLGELRSETASVSPATGDQSRDQSRNQSSNQRGQPDLRANEEDATRDDEGEGRDNGRNRPDSGAAGRPPTNRPEADNGPDTSQMEMPEVRAPVDEQAEIVTLDDPGSGEGRQLREPTPAEQQAYDQAFRALRETRYADAAEDFDAFLRDHPESSYAPNALYWLGEVYYVTRDFETALAQFERLQDTYPDSGKKADALLKIGFSHYELGNWERARAALEQVIADFPGTNYSRLAENRLRTMRLEGNL